MALNQGKSYKSGVGIVENAAPTLFLCPKSQKMSVCFFVVLCSNKEQQKHCVARELNQETYKFKDYLTIVFRTIDTQSILYYN